MTFTSPFKLVGKKTNGQMWVILDQTEGDQRAPVDLARQSDLSE
jgi:hypothetical protein